MHVNVFVFKKNASLLKLNKIKDFTLGIFNKTQNTLAFIYLCKYILFYKTDEERKVCIKLILDN